MREVFFSVSLLLISAVSVGAQTGLNPAEDSSLPEELSLEEALSVFRTRSPLLAAEAQREVVAQGVLEQAGKWPNLFFSFDTEEFAALNGANGGRTYFFGVGQEIQLGNQPGKRRKVAQSLLLAARNDVRAFERLLSFQLKVVHAALVRAQSDLELAGQSLAEFDQIVSLSRIRYQRGEISGGELRRVEAERLRFLEDQVAAEIELESSRAELLGLLGLPEYSQPFRAVPPERLDEELPDKETLVVEAMGVRAEIAAQAERKEAARRQVDFEKSLAVPNLVPFVNYQRVDGGSSNFINFGLSIGIPLLNRNQGGVARARAESLREEALEKAIRYRIAVEVRKARQAFISERKRIRFFEQTYLRTSREARDIAESAYRMGAESLINFLDASRVYRETLRAYNGALFDLEAARYGLELALGKELS
jgi:cobalt-zinc-cadmium efflux system outer membrane protein